MLLKQKCTTFNAYEDLLRARINIQINARRVADIYIIQALFIIIKMLIGNISLKPNLKIDLETLKTAHVVLKEIGTK